MGPWLPQAVLRLVSVKPQKPRGPFSEGARLLQGHGGNVGLGQPLLAFRAFLPPSTWRGPRT